MIKLIRFSVICLLIICLAAPAVFAKRPIALSSKEMARRKGAMVQVTGVANCPAILGNYDATPYIVAGKRTMTNNQLSEQKAVEDCNKARFLATMPKRTNEINFSRLIKRSDEFDRNVFTALFNSPINPGAIAINGGAFALDCNSRYGLGDFSQMNSCFNDKTNKWIVDSGAAPVDMFGTTAKQITGVGLGQILLESAVCEVNYPVHSIMPNGEETGQCIVDSVTGAASFKPEDIPAILLSYKASAAEDAASKAGRALQSGTKGTNLYGAALEKSYWGAADYTYSNLDNFAVISKLAPPSNYSSSILNKISGPFDNTIGANVNNSLFSNNQQNGFSGPTCSLGGQNVVHNAQAIDFLFSGQLWQNPDFKLTPIKTASKSGGGGSGGDRSGGGNSGGNINSVASSPAPIMTSSGKYISQARSNVTVTKLDYSASQAINAASKTGNISGLSDTNKAALTNR
jgi:hypothetical protein